MITVKINLDLYSPSQIISMHIDGVITLDEIIDSGRANSCFTTDLKDYINTVRPERRTVGSDDDTLIIRGDK